MTRFDLFTEMNLIHLYQRFLLIFTFVSGAPQWPENENNLLLAKHTPIRFEIGHRDLVPVLGRLGLLRGSAGDVHGGANRATLTPSALSSDTFSLPLKRFMLTSSRAKCNDGSAAGFYYRLASKSRNWIVFLEGGWYCFDLRSCQSRWKSSRHLMTSVGWSKLRSVGGILSSDPLENPQWWKSNHIYVPYCSSDCWSGTQRGSANISYNSVHALLSVGNTWHHSNRTRELGIQDLPFLGANILEEVVKNLVILGLKNEHSLILAGSSAGGLGVLLNIDRVYNQLSNLKLSVDVRGISDSAWFLDNEPFAPMECYDALTCAPKRAVQMGLSLWDAQIPSNCKNKFAETPWDCYLGYKALPTIQRPVFIFQWIFDEAQMMLDNVGKPVSKQQWNYIHSIGERIISSFSNVSAVFAPSCISHAALTTSNWSGVKIGKVSLLQALQCWLKVNGSGGNPNYLRVNPKERNRPPTSDPESITIVRDDQTSVAMESVAGKRDQQPPFRDIPLKPKKVRHSKNKKNKCRKCRKKSKQKKRKRKQSQNTESSEFDKMFEDANNEKVNTVKMLSDSPGVIDKERDNDVKFHKLHLNKRNKERRRKQERKRERKRRRRMRKRERRKEKKKQKLKDKKSKTSPMQEKSVESNEERQNRRSTRASLNSSLLLRNPIRFVDQVDEAAVLEKPVETPETAQLSAGEVQDLDGEEASCSFHLVDRCSWPHCNPSCPLLINPYTGEEMNRVQLLKSFGLSMVDLAHALGVDMPTLKAMDNKDIFLILTP